MASRRVICLNDDKIYPSAYEAERNYNFPPGSLFQHLNGWSKQYRGYKFEYIDPAPKKQNKGFPKPVICLNTGKEYPSISAAALATGESVLRVSRKCRGIIKNKGLMFAYKESTDGTS